MAYRVVATKRVSLERLRYLLSYDPDTGLFVWNVRKSWVAKPGQVAGSLVDGYVSIGIDGRSYQAHQLAWFYVHGVWSEHEIDHIDTMRSNNAIDNLREATSAQNKMNLPMRRTNTSGFKGVSRRMGSIGWQAKIQVNRRQIHIGYFRTPEEAHQAYAEKAQELFGDRARP